MPAARPLPLPSPSSPQGQQPESGGVTEPTRKNLTGAVHVSTVTSVTCPRSTASPAAGLKSVRQVALWLVGVRGMHGGIVVPGCTAARCVP